MITASLVVAVRAVVIVAAEGPVVVGTPAVVVPAEVDVTVKRCVLL